MPDHPQDADSPVQQVLSELVPDDQATLERLFTALYQELHTKARGLLAPGARHTLQPTALVNEAFMRIQRAGGPWQSREHFLLAASSAMRHVLVDHFRRKISSKGQGIKPAIEIELIADEFQERSGDVLGLNDALQLLQQRDPVMAQVVDLRFFGGASMEEIATILGVPQRTLERRWSITRSWLYGRLT